MVKPEAGRSLSDNTTWPKTGEVEEERRNQVYAVICLQSMSCIDVPVSFLARRAPTSAVLQPKVEWVRTDLDFVPISFLYPNQDVYGITQLEYEEYDFHL